MIYSFDENIVSDLHKDARGFRPGSVWMAIWNESSDFDKQKIWDGLCDELQESMAEEERQQRQASIEFEARIAKMGELGAPDVGTALRWIFDAEGVDQYDARYGASFICWKFNLSYQHGLVPLFDFVLKEMYQADAAA